MGAGRTKALARKELPVSYAELNARYLLPDGSRHYASNLAQPDQPSWALYRAANRNELQAIGTYDRAYSYTLEESAKALSMIEGGFAPACSGTSAPSAATGIIRPIAWMISERPFPLCAGRPWKQYGRAPQAAGVLSQPAALAIPTPFFPRRPRRVPSIKPFNPRLDWTEGHTDDQISHDLTVLNHAFKQTPILDPPLLLHALQGRTSAFQDPWCRRTAYYVLCP